MRMKCAWIATVGILAAVIGGCIGSSASVDDSPQTSLAKRTIPLESLQTDTLQVDSPAKDGRAAAKHDFRVWLALTDAQRTEGLMYVPESSLPDDQGMLFAFVDERIRGFWMRNTITALDIAFARRDGTIVAIHTMPPLTMRTFSSIEPAMFALEVKSGTFTRLGIAEGDKFIVPDAAFKASP